MIWNYLRARTLVLEKDPDYFNNPFGVKCKSALPVTLSICRESRIETLQQYEVPDEWNQESREENTELGIPIYYYDPVVDILEICSDIEFRIRQIGFEYGDSDVTVFNAQMELAKAVRHVIYRELDFHLRQLIDNDSKIEETENGERILNERALFHLCYYAMFPNLLTLTIEDEEYSYYHTPEEHLELEAALKKAFEYLSKYAEDYTTVPNITVKYFEEQELGERFPEVEDETEEDSESESEDESEGK
jgi:hypothetical protein